MKRFFFFSLLLACCFSAFAVRRVTLAQLQSDWQSAAGHTVCITTPLVVCGTFPDSVVLAPQRLYVPEEHAAGLADGDSADYSRLAALNREMRICLQCPKPYSLNLGATVRNLTAQVTGIRRLTTGKRPSFRNYRPSKRLPSLGSTDVVVCAANVQNYFVHLGGYASARTTPAQHALQCYKVASALLALKADLYALCELEKGSSAPAELAGAMNALSRKGGYTFVRTHTPDGDTISVGFVYDSTSLRPCGELLFAAPAGSIYSQRFMLQGFTHIPSGGSFVVSLNHLRSKRGTPQESLRKRMANVDMLLSCIGRAYADSVYTDPDLLLLGDYNSYAQELPVQTIVRSGYADLTCSTDSLAYTYSFNGECGALDRVFASPSMQAQVTAVLPVHLNTDYYWSAAYWSKYNFRRNTVPHLAAPTAAPTAVPTAAPTSSPSSASPSSPSSSPSLSVSLSPSPSLSVSPSSSLSSSSASAAADAPSPSSSPSYIRRYLSPAAKRNLLFRYSDHDPLLIGIRFTR